MPHWPHARIAIAVLVIGLVAFGFMPIKSNMSALAKASAAAPAKVG
jgi:hypothetical protein